MKDLKLNVKAVEVRRVRPKPITDILSGSHDRLNAFISSLANGFPLAFATFYPKEEDVKKEIDDILKEFLKSVEVDGRTVRRKS